MNIINVPSESEGALFVGRFTVPIDGMWHEVPLSGKVLSVGSRLADEVEMWALTQADESKRVPRVFRVFGTGHPLPSNSRVEYIGTTMWSTFVWHLFELNGSVRPGG